MKNLIIAFFFILAASMTFGQDPYDVWQKRTEWFREARFGMFIHWGVYAIPARGEWVRNKERITLEDYQKYVDDFNSVDYNPVKWAKIAKQAGMKYAVITVKHHSLLKLQQKEPLKWSIPLSGFFYRAKGDDAIFGYPASFAVASPVIGLVELCKLFPGHEKYKLWYEAIRLHANYLKTIAQLTAPYYMIPANVYKLSGKEEADAQVLNGIKMDDDHYLRMFPVWTSHRGNNANILSFGIGLAAANQLLKDPEMHNIAQSQLE